MSKRIQLPNVPDAQHRELEARDPAMGMSLSDYLLEEIEGVIKKPQSFRYATTAAQP